jgi:hypothetical protein
MADFSHRLRGRLRGARAVLPAVLLCLLTACQSLPSPESPGPGIPELPGTLRLRSSPSGALLYLDNAVTQLRTPTVVAPLPPGELRIKLILGGYREWEKTVLLGSGETLSLDVRLEPTATGTLKISSVPFGCRVYIDGRPAPHGTPLTLSDLSVGTHTIHLHKDGYEDWSHAIVILENRQLQLKASLKPARELTGRLRIQTSPSGAGLFLDGYPTGNLTPATLFNLQAGRHRVRIVKAGHVDWSEEVVISEGEKKDLLVNLRKEPRQVWGSAVIETVPPGAAIYLEGIRLQKRTPMVLSPLSHGSHWLKLSKEGYTPWEGELDVEPGRKARISVTLTPLP